MVEGLQRKAVTVVYLTFVDSLRGLRALLPHADER